MADLCRVLLVGNIEHDVERKVGAGGVTTGHTVICAGRTTLVSGYPQHETVRVDVEVVGAARVSAVAQQFGAGSRVLIEGHLERRETVGVERCLRADGAGDVFVQVPRSEVVLVIETIFNAATPLPAAEAQRQPTRLAWEEASA
ncbi:MAG: hypothetical protein RLZZ387_4099 [Chloroflexota bacterium]